MLFLLFCAALFPATPDLYANDVVLLRGKKTRMEGKVVTESIEIKTPYGHVTIPFESVRCVTFPGGRVEEKNPLDRDKPARHPEENRTDVSLLLSKLSLDSEPSVSVDADEDVRVRTDMVVVDTVRKDERFKGEAVTTNVLFKAEFESGRYREPIPIEVEFIERIELDHPLRTTDVKGALFVMDNEDEIYGHIKEGEVLKLRFPWSGKDVSFSPNEMSRVFFSGADPAGVEATVVAKNGSRVEGSLLNESIRIETQDGSDLVIYRDRLRAIRFENGWREEK
ncbi:MAG: hypothetical protein ACOC6C_04485 [Verrucomicrobiota bacterium]